MDIWRRAFQARITVSIIKHLFKKENGGLQGVSGRDNRKIRVQRKILHEEKRTTTLAHLKDFELVL